MGAVHAAGPASSQRHGQVAVQVRELFKRREQAGSAFELRVPELRLERGEFVAVVGESGCGKSTLLDILGLVLRPTSCELFAVHRPTQHGSQQVIDIKALWDREDEAGLAELRRQHVGYVLQSGGLLPFLDVRRNILLPCRLNRRTGADLTVRRLAGRLGIRSLLAKKPQFLSGGQRQRVAILRALAHDPMVVLADEPTGAVDKPRARAIVADLRAVASERGSTVVMVTHDLDLVAAAAHRHYTFVVEEPSETVTRSVCLPGS